MPARKRLLMHEELLLLALDDRKGTTGMSAWHTTAMAGAIMAELALLGAVRIGTDKKKLVDAEPGFQIDDPLLSDCLRLVQAAKRRKKASDWVLKFSGLKDLQKRVARGLVTRGVLNEETDKVLGLFTRRKYPARDGGPELELIERLREAVLTDTDRVEPRTMVVAVIAQATELLPRAIDKKLLKTRKARLKQLAEGQVAGSVAANATREAVAAAQAAQAAVLAAVVATTAATTVATS